MRTYSKILLMFFAFAICLVPVKDLYAGFFGNAVITLPDTDTIETGEFEGALSLIYVFDLRDRETFIQVTYPDGEATGLPARAHVQIFDVSNNCNENNFYDDYTINDTHIYNLRDIQTNDGNPSGVVLPDGAYGIVTVTMMPIVGNSAAEAAAGHFGNVRIIDDNGYEYRTNGQVLTDFEDFDEEANNFVFYSFNFNQQGGVSLSDVFGVTLFIVPSEPLFLEWIALPVQGIFSPFDIDIVDNNETIFSCRDVIFSCVNEDSTLLEELLSVAITANVASFEYGINDAIPHSKGGELLCPNNTVGEGTVLLKPEAYPTSQTFIDIIDSIGVSEGPFFFGFVGLNNGNGRGSMDSLWVFNFAETEV